MVNARLPDLCGFRNIGTAEGGLSSIHQKNVHQTQQARVSGIAGCEPPYQRQRSRSALLGNGTDRANLEFSEQRSQDRRERMREPEDRP